MAIEFKKPARWLDRLRGMFVALFLCGFGSFAGMAHAGYAAIVVDPATGQVLNAVNPDEQNYPASLAKMMTLYLTLQGLQSGTLKLDQQLPVSAWAASKAPTKLGLRRGQTISVEDCILGMVTKSANDAATVVAEDLGGSEDHFADLMNAQAARLGMGHTHFDNASGLPDPASVTTARDMVTLAMALYHDYPQYTHYFATKEFMFRGQLVRGHNRLMDRYPGMDGLKTGFTDASGFNLASTAVRDGQRLFAVVMGGHTASARDRLMARLLDDSFDHQQTPAILVAQAAGVGPSMTRRMLAALSPIGSAEAETVPVRQRHHRRGKQTLAASGGCTPHKGVSCPRRNQAHHPVHATTTRLAHRRNSKQKVALASRHADQSKAP